MMNTPAQRIRQRGSALIEVLVAILVLSIGLLGIAGLQASSMRFSQGTWARAAISIQLADIADRVRANPDSAETAYQLLDDYATQRSAIDGGTVTSAKDCEAVTTCTANEMAQFHLAQWRLALARDLPGGAAYISGARNTGYVVTTIWVDKNNVKADGKTLDDAAETCSAAFDGIRARNCCPAGAAVSTTPGIRCTNMVVMP